MKKITLTLAAVAAAISMNAQTVVWSDNFDDEDISDWTLYDEDGDGINWSVVQIQDTNGNPVGSPVLRSMSWSQEPLTPNNYAVSPAIDLTGEDGTETITLTWDVAAADASYADENYTVYVATDNSVSGALAATISYNELVSDNGPAGLDNFYTKTLDITSLAGETVYVVFRHHETSDEFTMEIDNVAVTGGGMGIDENSFEGFTYYQDSEYLTLKAQSPMANVEVYNLLGQKIATHTLNTVEAQLPIASLQAGVYVAKVTIEGKERGFKFVIN